jgi:hypothetical protein
MPSIPLDLRWPFKGGKLPFLAKSTSRSGRRNFPSEQWIESENFRAHVDNLLLLGHPASSEIEKIRLLRSLRCLKSKFSSRRNTPGDGLDVICEWKTNASFSQGIVAARLTAGDLTSAFSSLISP